VIERLIAHLCRAKLARYTVTGDAGMNITYIGISCLGDTFLMNREVRWITLANGGTICFCGDRLRLHLQCAQKKQNSGVGTAWKSPDGIDPERIPPATKVIHRPPPRSPASAHLTPLSFLYNFFQYPFHTAPLLLQKQKTLHA